MLRAWVMPRRFRVGVLLVPTLLACGDAEPSGPPPRPAASSLTVNPSSLALEAIGQSVQLTAEVRDQYNQTMSGVAVTWTSAHPGIATVSASGLLTAVRNGQTIVTATAGEAVGTAAVRVDQKASELGLSHGAATFRALGDTLRLSVVGYDANGHPVADAAVEWSSSDQTVVTVDDAGLMTAAGNGSAAVSASSENASASTAVTVEQEVVALGGLPAVDTLPWYDEPGDTLRLTPVAHDANGHAAPVAWSSSDTAVAKVDLSGLVLGVGQGVATITAMAGDLRDSTEVVVINLDKAVLTALYHATGGPNWKNSEGWLRFGNIGTWQGVRAERRGDLVVARSLNLSDNQLTGPIPPELGRLAKLEELYLQGNQLTGPIPPELGDLTNLQTLRLSGNGLTGVIPPELGRLARLVELILSGNELTGPIPPELGNLANLQMLRLSANQLTGAIPPELGNLANLLWLRLSSNQLTGPIPPELGRLARLERLSLQNNRLTGPIPPELGNVSSERFFILSLGGNRLTGSLPPELGNLKSLGVLSLTDNQLTGPIPPEFGNLGSLLGLSLRNNRLTGPVPPQLGDLANLNWLLIDSNPLSGALPDALVNVPLSEFRWHGTQLCAPNTEAFQQWLRSIKNHEGGAICGSWRFGR